MLKTPHFLQKTQTPQETAHKSNSQHSNSFQAIITSPFHRKNVCYQSILVIGCFNLIQLISQAFLSSNLLACMNVGDYFNVVNFCYIKIFMEFENFLRSSKFLLCKKISDRREPEQRKLLRN
jgi:hypothetical protein